jgi:hypothetical protein
MKAFLLSIAVLISGLLTSPLAFATTMTVTYQGTVSEVQDPSGLFGGTYEAGDPISGSFILDPIPAAPDFLFEGPDAAQRVYVAPGTWQTGPFSDTGNGDNRSAWVGPHFAFEEIAVVKYSAAGVFVSTAWLQFSSLDATTPQLPSLASYPKDVAALATLWGGTVGIAEGQIFVNAGDTNAGPFSGILFDVDDAQFTVTPIPAALPLLASALGGMAFLGWQRRKHAIRASTAVL